MPTLVAVPISIVDSAETDDALRRAHQARERGADLVEWRVDAIADDPAARPFLERLIERSPLPAIVTARSTEEGGLFDGTDAARADFTSFLAGLGRPPRYVDWELAAMERSSDLREAIKSMRGIGEHAPGLIISIHDFRGRPSDLSARILRAQTVPGASVIKVAWRSRSVVDVLEAFELLAHRSQPMIALCMGESGLTSRVLAPRFGGFLTFASSTDTEGSAPGQPTLDELFDRYRFRSIDRATKLYAVVGWPVAQSRGPVMHNEAFRLADRNALYLPIPIAPEYPSFKAAVASMIDATIEGRSAFNLRGLSVTIPHKESLFRFAQERGARIDEVTNVVGAANTLSIDDQGALSIANTDAPAIATLLRRRLHTFTSPPIVRIFGAGGVARAAAWAACTLGLRVEIDARNSAATDQLIAAMRVIEGATIDRAEAGHRAPSPHILINATPLGMRYGPDPEGSPCAPEMIHPQDTAFDTVYVPRETPMLRAAAKVGATCITGEQLLLEQAKGQYRIWTGQEPPPGAYAKEMV